MEDSKIVELFLGRSEQAIRELSSKYGSACFRVAFRILGNREDAEECVNDAYLGVWNSVPPQRPDPLRAYVFGVVRNLALKKYHENTAQKRNSFYDVALDEIGDVFPSADSPEQSADSEKVAESLDRFLGSLEPKDRIMFVRRYWYSDGIGDIAKRFGTTKHYVSVRLSRIRQSLKAHLEKDGIVL